MALSWLGWAYAEAGMEEQARDLLGEMIELSETRYISAFWIAVIYTGLGDKDKAFEWFEKAYEEHYEVFVFFSVLPFVDSLRDDPRFAELLKKVGLSEFPI